MRDFVDGTAFNNEQGNRARKLFAAVVLAALDDAIDLAVTKPTAIESFDETTLAQGRTSPAWPALDKVVSPDTGSLLLLEYSGDEEPDLDPIVNTLQRTGPCTVEVLAGEQDLYLGVQDLLGGNTSLVPLRFDY